MSDVIPLRPDLLRYDTDITVFGVPLVFGVEWRERVASWYLDLSTVDGEAIVRGRRITAGWSPLMRTTDARLPEGIVIVVRIGDSDDDPGVEEFGTAVLLMALTSDELAALEAPDDINPVTQVVIS